MANTADGALVEAARAGDQRAFGQLFDGWFDRVCDVSRRIVHDDGLAGEITQDTFLMAWTKLDTLQDVDAFGGWVLRIGRNTSLNRLAKERRTVSMDDEAMTVALDANAPDHDPLADLDQAGRISLVWDAAAALGPRDQSVLDLHLRHGLSATELAGELGTTPNNAHQILFTLKKRLGNSVRALVLWRAGHPTCPDLRQGLSVAGLTSFGAPMVKAIDAHVDGCATCSEDRTERLNPAALFAAAPVIAAGTLVKAKAAAALTQAGVPMSGSASAAAAGSTGAAGGSAGSSGSALGTGAPDTSLAPGSPPSGGMGGAVGGGPGGPTALAAGAGAGAAGAGGATAENVVSYPAAPDGPEGRSRSLANRRLLVAAVVLALIAIGAAVLLAGRSGDDDHLSTDEIAAPPTTAGTSARHTSTTDAPATSITTTTGIPDGTLRVIPRTTVPGSGDPGTTPPATVPTNTTPGAPGTTIVLTPTDPAPTTPPPTTTPGVDKPVILRFSVRSTSHECDGGWLWTLSWATLRADTVAVGWMQTPGQIGPADGKATICAPSDSAFFLNADGPGGRASTTVQGTGPTVVTTTTEPPTTEAPVTKPTRPPGQTG